MNSLHSKHTIFIILILLLASCTPAPWKAWRYDHKYDFKCYPSPWNLPCQDKFSSMYIDGAFLNIRVMAHNETTTTGNSPYMLIASILTNNIDQKNVTFHSINISSSINTLHVVAPINVDKTAEKTDDLSFPVTKQLMAYTVHKPTHDLENSTYANLWTDENLYLNPKKGEIIKIVVDVEIHKLETSIRKKIEYEFFPHKESGFFQWVSV